ncbi:MAG: phosphoethanolamine transferase [Comamonas sp.]|jgi:glucan phosphoethanolaminetransferase (alkaline phosphatase superfamily)|uniref:phosphoethanolamine transferase n=1 Tax=Comamonas sp. TaxID=34028 RepID=UPI0028346508|nr:phosphoethanolamine transferase [Comamonas sp.]MDR0214189.1 phosphoethanolamine transferase [Comamonas sp.]
MYPSSLRFAGFFHFVMRFLFLTFTISVLLIYGLGYGHLEDAGDVARSTFFLLTTWGLFLCSPYRRWALNITFSLGLFFALYMVSGVGVDYGAPNMSLVASLVETNPDEGMEFLNNLSWRDCLLSLLTIVLLIFYRFWLVFDFSGKLEKWDTYLYKYIWFFLILINIFSLFFYHGVQAYKKYTREKVIVRENLKVIDWNIAHVQKNKSLKVLVIGESVNKRYMSLMGSHWDTTPFLSSSQTVTAYTQYHSPAPNTVASLSRTLSLSQMSDGSYDLNRNVVSLANAAGYKTLWVSNQRSMGPNDSNVARMAHQANQSRFLDKPPVVEPARDDFALLNYLESKLRGKEYLPQDSVIFLHMIGSHPHACTRVKGMDVDLHAGHGRHIDCYLTSIQKLDSFMKELTHLLTKYAQSYEILYVSDHSLRVSPMTKMEKIMDGVSLPTKNIYVQPQIQEAYDTPLVFISSMQQKAKKDVTPLSGFDFLHLFGNWLGVQSPWIRTDKNLQNPSSSAPIQVFNWSQMVPLDSLPDAKPL